MVAITPGDGAPKDAGAFWSDVAVRVRTISVMMRFRPSADLHGPLATSLTYHEMPWQALLVVGGVIS